MTSHPKYFLEYARSDRSKCSSEPNCKGSDNCIPKGHLRLGKCRNDDSGVFQEKSVYAWRHWGCVKAVQFTCMKKYIQEAAAIAGYENLTPEDQARVSAAWRAGRVSSADAQAVQLPPPLTFEEKMKNMQEIQAFLEELEADSEEEQEELEMIEEFNAKRIRKSQQKRLEASSLKPTNQLPSTPDKKRKASDSISSSGTHKKRKSTTTKEENVDAFSFVQFGVTHEEKVRR
ncbi:poly polymerase and DNA-ligase Zn-finger region-domain-containing protein [Mycena rebaudengoi]|nr:poly polymerase and DNA-ligase Zn-finger region-domain-containing protein [Mycena rebaudengoi]